MPDYLARLGYNVIRAAEVLPENHLSVTNLAAGGSNAKVVYIYPMKAISTVVYWTQNLRMSMYTTNANLWAEFSYGVWANKRSVGDVVTSDPTSLADFLCGSTTGHNDTTTYTELGDAPTAPFSQYSFASSKDTVYYVYVWAEVYNNATTAQSGTIYYKNLYGWWTSVGVIII